MTSQNALETLSQHGKSFRFAGMFLSKNQLLQAARLYQFCRLIDDIADNTTDKNSAIEQLSIIKEELHSKNSNNSIVLDFIDLQDSLNLSSEYPVCLIDGVLTDMNAVAFNTQQELIRYAYSVAGVVGLMMCPILGADKKGKPFAIDLGIAMQLTNIARDVLEDANMGRRYLPADWCSLSAKQIALSSNRKTKLETQKAIESLLSLAESYYASARLGFVYLPSKSRRAIAIASNVYREIGIKLQRNKLKYWKGRTVVSTANKIQVAMKTLILSNSKTTLPHNRSLHMALQNIHSGIEK